MYNFISKSPTIQDIIKGLDLTKSLFVSSIIIGEPHTGKKALISSIFGDLPLVSAKDNDMIKDALQKYDELIITDLEYLQNISPSLLEDKKIIATANSITNQNFIDEIFAFIYHMPPLKERPEDIKHLSDIYIKEAKEKLMVDKDIDISKIDIDLTENTKTLQTSIYKHIIKLSMSKDDIKESLYNYIYEHIDGNNAYKEFLDIYEEPLIKAGLAKYHSQLKLSSILGINRNTLRKKILEHKIDA
jgi:DNA-binding protein Fis